ncbi:MAG: glycosyltransferase family 2 protein [Dermatophilaceae bacterium]
MSSQPVDVALVVVTYNSARHITGFGSALRAGLDNIGSFEIVVVDNASSDDTVERVCSEIPFATVVQTGRNGGYAAGINAGVAAAQPHRSVMVLNPDVRLGAGSVARLCRALEQPGVGIAVPRILDTEGATYPSLRWEPSLPRAFFVAVIGGHRAGRFQRLGEVMTRPAAYEAPRRADWATGAAMLISRDCWQVVGGWDESFFLFSEETDFALRAKDAGLLLQYVPDAVVMHDGGITFSDASKTYALLARNRVKLYGKRHGPVATSIFRALTALHEALRGVRGDAKHRAALRALMSSRPDLVLHPELATTNAKAA